MIAVFFILYYTKRNRRKAGVCNYDVSLYNIVR